MIRYTALAVLMVLSLAVVPALAGGDDLEMFSTKSRSGETIVFRSRGPREDTLARINLLIKGMENSAKSNTGVLSAIGETINKTWYLNSEFEGDQRAMLGQFRESLDYLNSLGGDLESLKAELFDPSSLGIDDVIKSVNATGKFCQAAYDSMKAGSSQLSAARQSYSKTSEFWGNTDAALKAMLSKLKSSLPSDQPVVPPAPPAPPVNPPAPPVNPPAPPAPVFDPNNMTVIIINEKVSFNQDQTILGTSPEGQAVIVRMKKNMSHLTTLERLQINQALKGQDGFSYVIRKVNPNVYYFFWWNLLNEVGVVIHY